MDIELSQPDHVTADYVGEPGERVFYIQASEASDTVSVLVEKAQVAGLAGLIADVLADVGTAPAEAWDIPAMRLREPVTPRWRAGTIGVGIEPQLGRFLLEIGEFVPEDDDRVPERVRLWLTEEQARTLAAHAAWSVAQGRPLCQLCGLPEDPEGHLCPRSNGDARER